jgi:hypothetical protein
MPTCSKVTPTLIYFISNSFNEREELKKSYNKFFLKDKPKEMAFKKFLEDTTQYLSGPSQMSYDGESISELLKLPDSEEQFHDSVNLGDSDSDSDENLLINSFEIKSLYRVLKS